MDKEGLKTYNDLFIDKIGRLKLQLLDYNYMYIHNN